MRLITLGLAFALVFTLVVVAEPASAGIHFSCRPTTEHGDIWMPGGHEPLHTRGPVGVECYV